MTRSFTLLVKSRSARSGRAVMGIAFGPYPWAYFEWQLMSLEEKESAVWISIDNACSQPVTRSHEMADYVPTQVIAYAGYDAIGSKS
ncbi:hypothetical protein [Agrobacterium rosae]|uniref:Uncharacterized protein n=1 Tax=Agrobacterium rosae TaxID=1972867 RepID=A0A1R3U0U4_9HYPH|nr:hypothetical protein [Agrobacterium rosae]SCX34535.1 hypothetical protein DSM25559_4504 [Agrobacterium rosae]